MTKKKQLDLTHVLNPLNENLEPTIHQLCPNLLDDPLDEAMAGFVAKYNTPHFSSLDELLEVSASQAIYRRPCTSSLVELLKDLS